MEASLLYNVIFIIIAIFLILKGLSRIIETVKSTGVSPGMKARAWTQSLAEIATGVIIMYMRNAVA